MQNGSTEKTLSAEHTVPEGHPAPALIIVMGVAGSGKSTVAERLAKDIGCPFVDGDDLHPKSNVEKMSRGEPLTDEDREPWLAVIRSTAERMCAQQAREGEQQGERKRTTVVIVCSALKKLYRDILRGDHPSSGKVPEKSDMPSNTASAKDAHLPSSSALETYFIFLDGTRELLEERMKARKGHFMKPKMLDSQLKTLENPVGEKGVGRVDIDGRPEEVEARAREEARRLVGV